MPVDLKKNKFAPAGVQAGSSSRTFHSEVTGAGGKVQSKNYTGWNANSYNNTLLRASQLYNMKIYLQTCSSANTWLILLIGP